MTAKQPIARKNIPWQAILHIGNSRSPHHAGLRRHVRLRRRVEARATGSALPGLVTSSTTRSRRHILRRQGAVGRERLCGVVEFHAGLWESSLSSSISSGGNGPQEIKELDKLLSHNPGVKFHNRERGYVRCTLTPETWRSDYQVVEDVTKPEGAAVTRASFVVEAGHAGAKPA